MTAFVPFFLGVQGKCSGGQSEIVVDIFVWLIHLSCRWHTKVNKESFKNQVCVHVFCGRANKGSQRNEGSSVTKMKC